MQISSIHSEQDLYVYLLKDIVDLEKASDRFSVYDFYSISKQALFEVKVRKTHYDKLLIERDKYEAVLSKSYEFGYTAYYICATPTGVYVFDLSVIDEPAWSTRYMPTTTEFSNREKKIKNVGYIDVCDALKI